ncbi:MAG: hypothetical protein LBM08_13660 [Dysgonamonadaceae bacterium]|jgi:YD repeat-containing protein|nr:hypothetical protein [Dysgonamonadaceae bacterium]
MKKINISLFLLLCNFSILCAQTSDDVVSSQDVFTGTYQHPDAFQHVEADLFRGNLQVNIPLYEYRTPHLKLPISLNYSVPRKDYDESYHSGWTGWGWHLSAGGSISRRIRGIPDELATDNARNQVWPLGNKQYFDTQEDEFTFNFCGYSGSFVFKNTWVIQSESKIWIDCRWDVSGLGRALSGFILRTPDGIAYYFGRETNVSNNSVESGHSVKTKDAIAITVWHLSKIVSPEGDCIELNYEYSAPTCNLVYEKSTYQVAYYTIPAHNYIKSYSQTVPDPQDTVVYGTATDAFIEHPAYLRSISGGDVTVYFNRSIATEKNYSTDDLKILKHANYPASPNLQWYKLDNIVFKDVVSNRDFKKYTLTYTSDTPTPLKLLSVQEQGILPNNTAVSKPAYTFEYDYKFSRYVTFKGLLKKMTYPTGGYSIFTYDYHNVYGKPLPTAAKDIGYRIRRILSYSGENELPFIREYSYLQPRKEYGYLLTESGSIGRSKRLSYNNFYSYYGYEQLEVSKTSNMDMPLTIEDDMRDADLYGYTCVTETQQQGAQVESEVRYTFVNYANQSEKWLQDPKLERIIDEPKFHRDINIIWYQLGKLVEKETLRGPFSARQTTIDYRDPECPLDTLFTKKTIYYPVDSTHSYVRKDSAAFHFREYRPKRIIETVPNEYNGKDTVSTTTLTWDWQTGNILCRETADIYGDIYKTEYHFVDYATTCLFNSDRIFNVPYEIVSWKNGKVIAAEVFQDSTFFAGGSVYYRKPVKKYILEIEDPVSNYQPASIDGEIRDSRCKLAASYNYYPATGLLKRYQETGKEPITFYWGVRNRLVAKIVGAEYAEVEAARGTLSMEPASDADPAQFTNIQKLRARLPNALITSYTYNIHGLTSVTDPTGRSRYAEYDALGQPVKTVDDAGNIRQILQYDYRINP